MPSYKTRDLVRAIKKLGFVERRHSGAHAIYQHPERNLTLTLPVTKREVPPVVFYAIAKQIENFGIVPEGSFRDMVGGS